MTLTSGQAVVRDTWKGTNEWTIIVDGKEVVTKGVKSEETPAESSGSTKGRQKKDKKVK